jgi:ABC-type dipeptide/oligopeptide/nickel transport system ATPase component
MADLAHEGRTMIVVTHEMDFAHEAADRVYYMDKGEFAEVGPPEQVIDAPKDPRTKEFLSRFRTRYPRERLLRSLSLLLWGQTNAPDHTILSACLNCGDSSLDGSVRAYENLWHRFN